MSSFDALANWVRREAGPEAHARSSNRVGEITDYNPETHAVKARLQPEEVETGWMPLGAIHVGNGFGIAAGANIGDQVILGFLDGDHSAPFVQSRIFSDQQKAPAAKSGEMVLFHQSGTRHVFAEDGSHTATHSKGGTQTWAADGSHATDLKDKPKTLMAGPVTEKVPRKVVTGVVHLATGGMGV